MLRCWLQVNYTILIYYRVYKYIITVKSRVDHIESRSTISIAPTIEGGNLLGYVWNGRRLYYLSEGIA